MKHQSEVKIEIETNLKPLKKHTVSIDAENFVDILDLIRNKMYGKNIQTLNQEYISNARDAHREINNKTDRVIITAPTEFDPNVSYRDFGPGISPDRIEDVVIKIFKTTKLEDENQVGGYGLGFKSAWSYTDIFCFYTYIDGIERFYNCYINEKNTNDVDLVHEIPTSERNGTKVVIPVQLKDFYAFKTAIRRCIYFWKEDERPIVHNIENLEFHNFNGILIGNIEVWSSYDRGLIGQDDNVAIIDGIPYPITDALIKYNPDVAALHDKFCRKIFFGGSKKIWHYPGNGGLRPMPNREQLFVHDRKFKVQNYDKMAESLSGAIDKAHFLFETAKSEVMLMTSIVDVINYMRTSILRNISEIEITFDKGKYSYVRSSDKTYIKLNKGNITTFYIPRTKRKTDSVELIHDSVNQIMISFFDLQNKTTSFSLNDQHDYKLDLDMATIMAHCNAKMRQGSNRKGFCLLSKPLESHFLKKEDYIDNLNNYNKILSEFKAEPITTYVLSNHAKRKIFNLKTEKMSNDSKIFYFSTKNRRQRTLHLNNLGDKKYLYILDKDGYSEQEQKEYKSIELFLCSTIIFVGRTDFEIIKDHPNFIDFYSLPEDYEIPENNQNIYFRYLNHELLDKLPGKEHILSSLNKKDKPFSFRSPLLSFVFNLYKENLNAQSFESLSSSAFVKSDRFKKMLNQDKLNEYLENSKKIKEYKEKTNFLFNITDRSYASYEYDVRPWIRVIEAAIGDDI